MIARLNPKISKPGWLILPLIGISIALMAPVGKAEQAVGSFMQTDHPVVPGAEQHPEHGPLLKSHFVS